MFPVLDSLDNVEDNFKQFFEETDGKFKFNKSKYDLAVTAPVNNKNRELLGKVAKFKELDDADLERIKKLKAKADKLGSFDEWLEAQDDEGDDGDDGKGKKTGLTDKEIRVAVQAERKRLTDAHTAALSAERERVAALERKFEERELDLALDTLAIEHGVIPKRLPTWKAAVRNRFMREDGELVYLEGGKPSASTTAEQAVRDVLFKDFDYLYEAREAGGGSGKQKQGAGKDRGPKTLKRADFDKLNPADKAAFFKEKGSVVD